MADVVNLADVKVSLNITKDADDEELLGVLDDAIEAVEDVVGPLHSQTVVEVFDEHGPAIVLSQTPVLAVDSVSIEPWLGASPVDDTLAWRLNPTTGVLRRQVAGGTLPFYGRGSIFTVTYRVGRASVPGPVNRAILTQVKSMWRSQRVASNTPVAGAAPAPAYQGQQGFLGADVMELLTPYLPPPGAA